MSEKEKNCLNCRIHWDREGCCKVCRWEDRDHPSLFYQITLSPEVLADKIVMEMEDFTAEGERLTWWESPIMPQGFIYRSKQEAYEATLARLLAPAESEGESE